MGQPRRASRRDRRKRLRRRQENAKAHERTFATIVDEAKTALVTAAVPSTEQPEITDSVSAKIEEGGDAA